MVQTILALRMAPAYVLSPGTSWAPRPMSSPVETAGPAGRGPGNPSLDHARQALMLGVTGAGSSVLPLRYVSMPAAAARPSAIAHTTSDCPRPASPATNTPGTDVA